MTRALAHGTPIVLDPGTSFSAGGRVATGGAPWAIARFTDAALPHLRALRTAGPGGWTPDSATGRALARQLLDRGLAHPLPEPRPGPHQVTVVVPAFGRPDELDRCLAALHGLSVIVVDDASPDPAPDAKPDETDAATPRDIADRHGAQFVRHRTNRGPAAARNTGLALAHTDLVAFVDSDCRPHDGWLDVLIPYFDDPKVAAVAPRVLPDAAVPAPASVPTPASNLLARYEAARSALDMGPRQALVRPGAKLGFVPTATLVVRRNALAENPFDEDLRLGEDVDLVWRLHDRGLHIRYQPQARVAHTPRPTWPQWARRRHEYGTSAAPLAQRHPGRLAPARPSAWNLAALACIAYGRPLPAAACAALTAALLRRGLSGTPGATALSGTVVAKGITADAAALGHALRREWWPLGLACLAASHRDKLARAATAAMLVPLVAEWLAHRPALDPVRWAVLRLADDIAYGTGVTASAYRHRTLAPLLPDVRLPFLGRGRLSGRWRRR